MSDLDPKQLAIIDRATSRIKKAQREAFRKYVEDVLRCQIEPSNATVRHICAAALIRWRKS